MSRPGSRTGPRPGSRTGLRTGSPNRRGLNSQFGYHPQMQMPPFYPPPVQTGSYLPYKFRWSPADWAHALRDISILSEKPAAPLGQTVFQFAAGMHYCRVLTSDFDNLIDLDKLVKEHTRMNYHFRDRCSLFEGKGIFDLEATFKSEDKIKILKDKLKAMNGGNDFTEFDTLRASSSTTKILEKLKKTFYKEIEIGENVKDFADSLHHFCMIKANYSDNVNMRDLALSSILLSIFAYFVYNICFEDSTANKSGNSKKSTEVKTLKLKPIQMCRIGSVLERIYFQVLAAPNVVNAKRKAKKSKKSKRKPTKTTEAAGSAEVAKTPAALAAPTEATEAAAPSKTPAPTPAAPVAPVAPTKAPVAPTKAPVAPTKPEAAKTPDTPSTPNKPNRPTTGTTAASLMRQRGTARGANPANA